MVPCPCWLLVAVMAYVCVPGFGSECLGGSICNDLSNKGRILDCIRLCMSVIQSEYPELSALALKVNQGDEDDDELLLSIVLAILTAEDKAAASDLRPHSNRQRSYSMEHFRWGKPLGVKTQQPKAGAQKDRRRSYSMEHFRWGKPPGRKRRPVKILASRLEGGGSPEARRQVGGGKDQAKGEQNQIQAQGSAKGAGKLGQQERKDSYRMSHFRWGSPPASKRNSNFMKVWEEKRQGQLASILRNIIIKDMRRIMG